MANPVRSRNLDQFLVTKSRGLAPQFCRDLRNAQHSVGFQTEWHAKCGSWGKRACAAAVTVAVIPNSAAIRIVRAATATNGIGSNREGTHRTTPPRRSGADCATPAMSPAICVATWAVCSPRWSIRANSRVAGPVLLVIGVISPWLVWNSSRGGMERASRCRMF